jgi:CRISP-associated protein Cas1
MALAGRLGLDSARVPHADRNGLIWLRRGRLFTDRGCVRYAAAGDEQLAPGEYDLPHQMVSCLLLEPGTTVTHAALRTLAAHGTGVVFCGEDGVRFYASLPASPGRSDVARRHAILWADPAERLRVARTMYALRLSEVLPDVDLDTLRGIEGARMREAYRLLARRHRVEWVRRAYDRQNPEVADLPNKALNHVATAMEAAALVAVAAVGAVPDLGFIHETASSAFALDISDLYRTEITVPIAFTAASKVASGESHDIERTARRLAGQAIAKGKIVPQMIDRIKTLLGVA